MTIQEILTAHTQSFDWYPCKCGWKPVFDGRGKAVDQHRAHVAEVLEQHMQEREAAVLLKARDRMAKHWPLALDEFLAGEVCDWMEHEADKIKEASNGR